MIRVLNFFCVAVMGLSILGLYHVSEKTRVASVELGSVNRQIEGESARISVLETEWEHTASPERIATLATSKLGLEPAATVQLSSLELLPRSGDEALLASSPVRNANVQTPAE